MVIDLLKDFASDWKHSERGIANWWLDHALDPDLAADERTSMKGASQAGKYVASRWLYDKFNGNIANSDAAADQGSDFWIKLASFKGTLSSAATIGCSSACGGSWGGGVEHGSWRVSLDVGAKADSIDLLGDHNRNDRFSAITGFANISAGVGLELGRGDYISVGAGFNNTLDDGGEVSGRIWMTLGGSVRF